MVIVFVPFIDLFVAEEGGVDFARVEFFADYQAGGFVYKGFSVFYGIGQARFGELVAVAAAFASADL